MFQGRCSLQHLYKPQILLISLPLKRKLPKKPDIEKKLMYEIISCYKNFPLHNRSVNINQLFQNILKYNEKTFALSQQRSEDLLNL